MEDGNGLWMWSWKDIYDRVLRVLKNYRTISVGWLHFWKESINYINRIAFKLYTSNC